jgi:hypothetical protein
MRINTPRLTFLAAGTLLVVQFSFSSAGPVEKAAKYAVAELKEAAPDALAPEVRDVLAKSGYRVTDSADKTICDLWLRAELPLIGKFDEQLDLKYPIDSGTLIGAVRFPNGHSDYRKQKIKPGTYTLRYGHQPQDGNHLGTAQYRDFAIVIPAAEDKSPSGLSQEKAEKLSTKVTSTTHPAICSLLPPQKRDKLPTMAHDDTLNLEVLVAKTAAKGGAAKEVQIEFVAVGHAPE